MGFGVKGAPEVEVAGSCGEKPPQPGPPREQPGRQEPVAILLETHPDTLPAP